MYVKSANQFFLFWFVFTQHHHLKQYFSHFSLPIFMLKDIFSINRNILYFLSIIIHTILHFIKSCVFGITSLSDQPTKKREEASVMCNKASDGSSAGAWLVQISKKRGYYLLIWRHWDHLDALTPHWLPFPPFISVPIFQNRNKHCADFNVWELCSAFMIKWPTVKIANRNWIPKIEFLEVFHTCLNTQLVNH